MVRFTGRVKFWAVINGSIHRVSGELNDTLVDFYKGLRDDPDLVQHLRVSYTNCKFYRLRNPVRVGEDDTDDESSGNQTDIPDKMKQALSDKTNWVTVHPLIRKIRQLAKEFSSDCIYLIIEFPDPLLESQKAIANLRRDHDVLFKCLHLTVKNIGAWCQEDVERNLQGGILTTNINDLPPMFRQIHDALARPRVYIDTDNVTQRDLENARSYGTQFDHVFTPGSLASRTVISDREFATFYNLLRCFHPDVELIADKETSSSLKTDNFTVHFIQPPFFSEIHDDSRGFKYQQEKSWGFPVFLEDCSTRSIVRKFTPKSDWMVVSPGHKIPFAISEVISDEQQKDRSRMLVEAIALARAGQFLLQPTSSETFFVVAIYVDKNMVTSRYIVMETAQGDLNTKVSIHKRDFDLRVVDEEVDFLREMYNLATRITELSGSLDESKKGVLHDIQAAASKVQSLNSTRQQKTKTLDSKTMDSIAEATETREPQDEDDLGIFEADDIQNILRQMNYKIKFIPWGHPQLAVIVDKAGDKHGYLKFVEREREVNVLRYLSEIESPSNHTISGVRFWPVEGGTAISMPVAGGWLTTLENPNEQLWTVAQQLIEAVGFMHEHNVAHMDLKPQNIIIPPAGGRLSIIDFSISIRVRDPGVRYKGVVGTEDYLAPEVHKGEYKPMLADLWSCGRTLEELCECCRPSVDRTMLFNIARRLMDRDPEARPKMSTVLEWMNHTRREDENVVSSTLLQVEVSDCGSPLCS